MGMDAAKENSWWMIPENLESPFVLFIDEDQEQHIFGRWPLPIPCFSFSHDFHPFPFPQLSVLGSQLVCDIISREV